MIIRELLTRLGFSVNESQLRRYEQGASNIKRSADEAAESFRNIFLAFAGFGAIRAIVKTADDLQSLEARIGQLPQTVETAAEAFDIVSGRATAARQSIEAYGSFYVKLQQAGKDFIKTQEEGLQVTDTISKALIVGGATAQEQSSALLQFGQAIGSGVLQGEELRALSEAAPQFLDALANAIGVPRAELKKFASEGKLTSKEVIEAVKKISTEFDERFKAIPLTIGQATTIVANRWGTFINRLNRESSAVTKTANFFLGAFDSIETGLGNLVDFFGSSTNTLKFFGIALAAALSPIIFQTAAGAIAFLISPLGLLIGTLVLAGLVIEDFYQFLTGGESVIGEFLNQFGEVDDFIATLGKFRDSVAEAFSTGVIAKFFAALVRLKDYLVNIIPIDEILTNIGQMFNGFVTIFSGLFDIVAGAFKVVLGFLTGDFDLWFEGVKQIFSGFADFVSGAWGIVTAVIKQSLVGIGLLFRIAFDAIRSIIVDSIFGGIVSAAKRGWDYVKSLFGLGATITPTTGAVTPATAAGAAVSAGGVPSTSTSTASIVVNQTLPPGTTKETADAARFGIEKAFEVPTLDKFARQMGQVQ